MRRPSGSPATWLWLHARACVLAIGFRWKLWHGETVIPVLSGTVEPSAALPEGGVAYAFSASRRAARYLASLDTCLSRSIVLFRLLEPFGGARMHIGVRTLGGGIAGHAWVSFRGVIVGESPEAVSPFTELPLFSPDSWEAEFQGAQLR